MKIQRDQIPHSAMRSIMRKIEETQVPVVLWGGSVRDVLLHRASGTEPSLEYVVKDVDLAVVLKEEVPTNELCYRAFTSKYTIPAVLEEAVTPLCRAWGFEVGDLASSDDGASRPRVCGTYIDLMGLRPVFDEAGNAYPDVFALDSGETFSAVPMSLSINRFALDEVGRVYGPLHFLDDFNNRTARMLNPPELGKFAIPLLLRLVDYSVRFGLEPEPHTLDLLARHVKDLKANPLVVSQSLEDQCTQALVRKVLGCGIHGQAAENLLLAILSALGESWALGV